MELAWIEGQRPGPRFADALGVLKAAHREGLDPERYRASGLDQARVALDTEARSAAPANGPRPAELDACMSYSLLQYLEDLSGGRLKPSEVDLAWVGNRRQADLAAVLERVAQEERPGRAFAAQAPRHREYAALRDGLATYRAIQAKGGWPTVPEARLHVGRRNPAVEPLRQRLAATGELGDAQAADPRLFDHTVESALKAAQAHHGLKQTGFLDRETLAALNVPVEQRIQQIEFNMERWRWMPDDLGTRQIRVNIPQYWLEVREGDQIPLTMRVIVGTAENKTPIFSDRMTHIVFSPYWNIPESIAREETIPAMREDPSYLERQRIEIVRVGEPDQAIDPSEIDWDEEVPAENIRFRQQPGPANSLGLVKFMFPNQFSVYLHDTPADRLFDKVDRHFSHGCVRVEQPVALARYLLRDRPEWTEDKINAAMRAGVEQHVKLTEPVPVYLSYWTAFVDPNGGMHFRDDLYDLDSRQTRLLAESSGTRSTTSEPDPER